MNRILQPWSEDIVAAFEMTERLGFDFRSTDFLCGVDPLYAGLHSFEEAMGSRSYRSIAHTAFRIHASDKQTTVVLPHVEHWSVVVHELGHVLDERQGYRWLLPAVSDHAKLDRWEAFAEAFQTFVLGDEQPPGWSERYDVLMSWDRSPESIFQ